MMDHIPSFVLVTLEVHEAGQLLDGGLIPGISGLLLHASLAGHEA